LDRRRGRLNYLIATERLKIGISQECVDAIERSALASLKQATALIPDPSVLINTIPLLEAQASSAIENIVTTTDAMFRAALYENRKSNRRQDCKTRDRLSIFECSRRTENINFASVWPHKIVF
jgi:hypothetical protein